MNNSVTVRFENHSFEFIFAMTFSVVIFRDEIKIQNYYTEQIILLCEDEMMMVVVVVVSENNMNSLRIQFS